MSEGECTPVIRSTGIVWQSCRIGSGFDRSAGCPVGFLQRRASQQLSLAPGHMKNCAQDTHPPQRQVAVKRNEKNVLEKARCTVKDIFPYQCSAFAIPEFM